MPCRMPHVEKKPIGIAIKSHTNIRIKLKVNHSTHMVDIFHLIVYHYIPLSLKFKITVNNNYFRDI